ncbi:MAG: hypothetical protein CM1200mP9_02420 [Gammaproteobacteria bacterium]|nr:MAG: hypothetical protein CM1200mP9_02420 [Gammaproteobacteria bacterium]
MYRYNEFDQQFVQGVLIIIANRRGVIWLAKSATTHFNNCASEMACISSDLRPCSDRGSLRHHIFTQLRAIAEISRNYDKGYGHLSTRQNVQLNWPELEEVPDILADLADVGMQQI